MIKNIMGMFAGYRDYDASFAGEADSQKWK